MQQEQNLVVEDVQRSLGFKERMEVLIRVNKERIESLKREVKELERLMKEHDSIVKNAMKKKKKVVDENKPFSFRKPSGLAAPVQVSKDLMDFLLKTKATMRDPDFIPTSKEEQMSWPKIPVTAKSLVARTDVNSHIHSYIKEHNLKKTEPFLEIVPDATLKKIFSEPTELSDPSDPNSRKFYSYKTFHNCISHHFPEKKSSQ